MYFTVSLQDADGNVSINLDFVSLVVSRINQQENCLYHGLLLDKGPNDNLSML